MSLSIALMFASVLSVKGQIITTQLQVTVIDELGNFVEGAEVKLFLSEKDYRSDENLAFVGKTNEKGRVKFKEVKTVAYFIDARKGDQNNNGKGVQTGVLTKGKVNKVNTVIE